MAVSATSVLLSFLSGDVRWEDGKVSGTVYSGEEKLTRLLVQVRCQRSNSASLHVFLATPQQYSSIFQDK